MRCSDDTHTHEIRITLLINHLVQYVRIYILFIKINNLIDV